MTLDNRAKRRACNSRGLRRYLLRVSAALLGVSVCCGSQAASTTAGQPEPSTGWQDKSVATASRYMAVTANSLATRTALKVLRESGTAVDAAIASQMVLNLVEPQSSGIGGGAFMLYWDAKARRLYTLDGRETAPAAAGPDYFQNDDGAPLKWRTARVGGRAVAVPGTLHLLYTAHGLFGHMAWADLLAPAIALASEGFAVSPRLSMSIAVAADKGLKQFPPAREYFFLPDGEPLPAGYKLQNPAFARTLSQIAQEGIGPFYNGRIGERLLLALQNTSALPALMTRDDLAAYRTIIRPPVCSTYRDYSICGMGPPSSGGLTVLQILGLVEGFNLGTMGPGPRSIHLILEASRLAFADRAKFMADSDFVPVPITGLLDPGYLADRARLIRTDGSMGKAKPGTPPGALSNYSPMYQHELTGTSHLSIVDGFGNVVSMTTTIESGFGSRLMSDGFLLNNEMTDFAFVPERDGLLIANRVEGGKRPRSSMAPTIVFDGDGEPVLVTGSPGGSRIICYVAQSVIATLDWGMNPQQAASMAHFCNRNGISDLEISVHTEELEAALQTLGHETRVKGMNSGLHIILRNDRGELDGSADPRREGLAGGE